MNREKRQLRSARARFETREQDNDLYISGYFAVFNSTYEIWEGMSESIDSHAFDDQLNEDVRALIDHETRLVIGRTKAGTLQLRVDDTGLWGDVKINRNDVDAKNVVMSTSARSGLRSSTKMYQVLIIRHIGRLRK